MAEIDYPAHLEAMWQKAIAPRDANAPTVISTFAGGGGSLTGYMMAGYRDLLAVEWDGNAVDTLRLNWPDLDIYHGDITNLTIKEVLERAQLQPCELDVLDGSPPCQGFSTAGKRILDDPRNQLFREYVRLLRGLQPKVFVMENVSGMVKGKMKLVFVEILKELKESGYIVSARLLNAMYFHVPQSRERLIFIGVRKDLGICPIHPKAESQPIVVRDALQKLATMQNGKPISKKAVRIWQCTPAGKTLDYGARKIYGKSNYYTHRKLHPDMCAGTIQKSIGSLIYHYSQPRGLSIEELKRLGSFPKSYRFPGLDSDAWARIGNSVPPLFMEAIARTIRAEILDKAIMLEDS